MTLDILTPEEVLFSGEVTSVRLPGEAGTFEVLNNHAPLISTLVAGPIRIKSGAGADQEIIITGGFVEVLDNKVSVIV